MGSSARPLLGLTLGAAFGAATSLLNAVASPHGLIGRRLVGTGWASVAEVGSLLLDSGWAWAALAVAAGWLVDGWVRGAAAGAGALLAATTTYFAADAVLRSEPFAGYWVEMGFWWIASLLLGSALGAVGAAITRRGVVGLMARLTVPVGAAVQMVVLPPGLNAVVANQEAVVARWLVWVVAVAAATFVVARSVSAGQPDRSRRTPRVPPSPRRPTAEASSLHHPDRLDPRDHELRSADRRWHHASSHLSLR